MSVAETASAAAPRVADGAKLSVVVVAHNEAPQLAECLGAVRFADEVVVLLDRCTDASRAIATGYADRIVEGGWPREAMRRQTAVAACTGDWIFEVDADERVSAALATELRAVIGCSQASWHLVKIDNYIGDRLVRWGWGAFFGRSAHVGLYRNGAKSWRDDRVLHASVDLKGPQGPTLQAPLAHFVDRNISDMLIRLDRYTTLRAQDLRESGDIGSFAHNLWRIASRFWKCYVGRRGYREGPYGFLIALCAALYPILSYLKARLEPPPHRSAVSEPGPPRAVEKRGQPACLRTLSAEAGEGRSSPGHSPHR